MRVRKLIILVVAALALTLASDAWAARDDSAPGGGTAPTAPPSANAGSGTSTASGGVGIGPLPVGPSTPAHPVVAGWKARIVQGVAYAPAYAPLAVRRAIWAGDQIRTKPYIAVHYASLAAAWPGYDCSGSVSFVLFKAGLMTSSPSVSGDFESYGLRGPGRWITVWGSAGHAFVEIAGIVFDTAQYAQVTPAGSGPRWQPAWIIARQLRDGNAWAQRHPAGL